MAASHAVEKFSPRPEVKKISPGGTRVQVTWCFVACQKWMAKVLTIFSHGYFMIFPINNILSINSINYYNPMGESMWKPTNWQCWWCCLRFCCCLPSMPPFHSSPQDGLLKDEDSSKLQAAVRVSIMGTPNPHWLVQDEFLWKEIQCGCVWKWGIPTV